MNRKDKIEIAFGESYKTAVQSEELEFIPTDIEGLNETIFTCGGVPRGRVMEIAGPNNTGKSTFMQWVAGQVQKRGGKVAWFDAERTFLKSYAAGSGINLDELVLPDFGLGEDMLHKVKLYVASNQFDLVVVDSQDAVKPSSLQEVEAKSHNMRERLSRAMMWAQFYRDLVGGYTIKDAAGNIVKNDRKVHIFQGGKEVAKDDIHKISDKKTCLAMIAHLVPKPGVVFGKQKDSSGGEEAKFQYSLRIWLLSRQGVMGQVKKQKVLKYSKVKIKVEKVKIGTLKNSGVYEVKMGADGSISDLSNIEDMEVQINAETLDGGEE